MAEPPPGCPQSFAGVTNGAGTYYEMQELVWACGSVDPGTYLLTSTAASQKAEFGN